MFLAAQPVLGVYHALAADKAVRGAAYAWYVEQRLEHAKRTIDDFVGSTEMEEIFAQTGQTEEIRKKLSLRLNDYVRTIPESFILQLEEQARLHLSLGRLASFPFASFFRYFNCVLGDTIDPKYPPFEHAPVMLTLDLMEKLHVGIGFFQGSAPDYLYAEEPIAYYLYLRAGLKREGKEGKSGSARSWDSCARTCSPWGRRSRLSRWPSPCWIFFAISARTPGTSSCSILPACTSGACTSPH